MEHQLQPNLHSGYDAWRPLNHDIDSKRNQ